jgi:biofilm protein TabA
MIVVDLDQLRDQVVLTPNIEKAIDFLVNSGQDDLPLGRFAIDGDNVYAEVQAYDTVERETDTFEGHKTYIDIQYVVSGEEIIAWASPKDVTETKAYDQEHDYWLGDADASKATDVRLNAGQLAVLYPADPHAPRRAVGKASPVRKLVVKVKI